LQLIRFNDAFVKVRDRHVSSRMARRASDSFGSRQNTKLTSASGESAV
jgi:hypothetical protein